MHGEKLSTPEALCGIIIPLFYPKAVCRGFEIRALIVDGNSEHVAHSWRKMSIFGEKNPFCDNFRSYQMP